MSDFGPAFIKVCAYFPYPIKVWVNGHEWAKRQADRPGSGSPSCPTGSPPAMIPPRCRRSVTGSARADPGVLRTLDEPATAAVDRARPNRRVLVGAVDAAGRDLPHPGLRRTSPGPGVLRGAGRRQPGHRPPGHRRADLHRALPTARTATEAALPRTGVVTRDTDVTVNAFFKHSRVKQYLKDGRALRIETVVNSPDDLGCHRRLAHLDSCRPRRVTSTVACSILNGSGRVVSLRAQPLSAWCPASGRPAGLKIGSWLLADVDPPWCREPVFESDAGSRFRVLHCCRRARGSDSSFPSVPAGNHLRSVPVMGW